ncbi:general stress protein [Salipaludibacillus neizhouensis]|uniref:General stress protein n=1 Tax=Salipaludibacillus neizhouensis TaxID=885475 RepID=A0A3A9KFG2_9BACI|nr:general stress protein [Salipaludibacillus neizhouensis]RKL66335.1 general stress protein [Salipaludibacillus neizhouensis]
MELLHKEFFNDEEVVNAVESLKIKGVTEEKIYVVTHDDERTKRVAEKADAETIGAKEQSFGTTAKNVFRKKGDELRAKFQEIGFDKAKAESLEGELDKGKVILIVKDAPTGIAL